MSNENIHQKTKCALISVVGLPNAGKSTFVNNIVGMKLSIVSPKAQTTRSRIKAIANFADDKSGADSQLVFIDTPGIFTATGKLNNQLNKSIIQTAKNSFDYGLDFICVMIDCKTYFSGENATEIARLIELTKAVKSRKILILNKVDIVEKDFLLKLTKEIDEKYPQVFESIFMVNATADFDNKKCGIKDVAKYFAHHAPDSPHLYNGDEISDLPVRFFAAEITREKLFLMLDKELPYSINVETEKFEEKPKHININQVIYVKSDAHKKIIIGTRGEFIKKVGESSRKEITKFIGKKVNLFLFVKVRKNWDQNPENYISSYIDFA